MEAAQDHGNQARNACVGKARNHPGRVQEGRPAWLRSLAQPNTALHLMLWVQPEQDCEVGDQHFQVQRAGHSGLLPTPAPSKSS